MTRIDKAIFVSYIIMHDKRLIEISFGPVSSLRRYRSKSF